MELPFLSADWFEEANRRVGAVQAGTDGIGCRVQFDAEASGKHVRWGMDISGRAVELGPGELPDVDIELRHTLLHSWQVFNEELNGDDALAGFTLVEERQGARYVGPPSPMELGQQTELEKLPAIPGASLDVQYEYLRGPFGLVSFFVSFVDGQVATMGLGRRPDPDVVAQTTFLQMAQVRSGDITILDVLSSGGKVKGPEGALALLAGISESPEFHAAELACGRSGLALAALGEVNSDPSYGAVMDELRAITGAPDGL